MNDTVISVRDVSKCYRVFDDQRSRLFHALWPQYDNGMQEVWALKDINVDIKRGEAVAIIGRNGGGKSTLLEILTGTLTPTRGEVKVNGRVSALLELGSGFNPEYTGRDNVILNGLLLGLSREEILRRFDEIEEFAEIGSAIERPVKTYSSGMMMRLAFAVQVLCDPDILIIDEALSVGDFFFQQKCLGFIRGACARGVTLLFVSHDMGTVREICNRGVFLQSGQIVFDGDHLEAIRLYLQNPSGNTLPNQQTFPPVPVSSTASNAVIVAAPLWALDSKDLEKANTKPAYLIAVGLLNGQGCPVTSVRMGTRVSIKVHYKVLYKVPVDVHVAIKNKYNQLLTAVGSYSLQIPPPELDINQEAVFELDIQLSMEAGDYSLCTSLVHPSKDGTSGTIFDETPWVGPIHVHWNYCDEEPPFYGLVGMNCKGKFLL